MKKNMELYIHVPFCVKKCAYCDFLSFPADEGYCDFTYTPLPETVERVVAASRNRKKKREA